MNDEKLQLLQEIEKVKLEYIATLKVEQNNEEQ